MPRQLISLRLDASTAVPDAPGPQADVRNESAAGALLRQTSEVREPHVTFLFVAEAGGADWQAEIDSTRSQRHARWNENARQAAAG